MDVQLNVTQTPPLLRQNVTDTWMTGVNTQGGDLALIAGIVAAILALLIVVLTVLLGCLSRQKGSYVTNEMDEDEDDDDNDDDEDDNNDNESVGSDQALQTREEE